MKTRYNYGRRYRNGGGPLNSLMKKYEHGGPHGKGSSAFFGVYPEEETEEAQEATRGVNMLPEVEIVGRKEQPKEEKKKERGFYQIEGDPKSKVIRGGKEMTLEQMNQLIIDEWNKNNPDDKKENILPMEKRIDFKGVIKLPLSPDRLLQKYMRGQLNEAYENDPDIRRQVDMAMREYEKRGAKFRDRMTRSDLFTTGVGTRPEIYQPGYGYSEEELAELIPRYAALAEERGMVMPKGFERFLTEE